MEIDKFLAQPKHDQGGALVCPGAFCRWWKWHTKKNCGNSARQKSLCRRKRRRRGGKGIEIKRTWEWMDAELNQSALILQRGGSRTCLLYPATTTCFFITKQIMVCNLCDRGTWQWGKKGKLSIATLLNSIDGWFFLVFSLFTLHKAILYPVCWIDMEVINVLCGCLNKSAVYTKSVCNLDWRTFVVQPAALVWHVFDCCRHFLSS